MERWIKDVCISLLTHFLWLFRPCELVDKLTRWKVWKIENCSPTNCPIGSRQIFEKRNLGAKHLTCGNVDKTCDLWAFWTCGYFGPLFWPCLALYKATSKMSKVWCVVSTNHEQIFKMNLGAACGDLWTLPTQTYTDLHKGCGNPTFPYLYWGLCTLGRQT
jgi:hypothetical protein